MAARHWAGCWIEALPSRSPQGCRRSPALPHFCIVEARNVDMQLKDKIAVITGGARGIGAAIARRYVAEGAKVAIADLLPEESQALAKELGAAAFAVPLDVPRQESIDAMVSAVVGRFGGIDILVNNAAIFDMAPIAEITRESYRKVFAVNVEGLLFTLQAVARRMIAQKRGGKIINFASQAGRR